MTSPETSTRPDRPGNAYLRSAMVGVASVWLGFFSGVASAATTDEPRPDLLPSSGHFVVECRLPAEEGSGLLLEEVTKQEFPDYIGITIGRSGEYEEVYLRSRMSGEVKAQHQLVLKGQYSVPPGKLTGTLRLFCDSLGSTIRSYAELECVVNGEMTRGFVELPPFAVSSRKWRVKTITGAGDEPAVHLRDVPKVDRDDSETGFSVTTRQYNWSGFFGNAIVVTFDSRHFPHGDRKFVFWESANYVPFWHLSNQSGLSYEFVETWGDGLKGCFEPMSDRWLRYSRVELVEDSPVRKRVRWRYALINPDYVPWGWRSGGTELPEVEELWSILPDGTLLRQQTYWPCTDSGSPLQWNQVAELDPMAGSLTTPSDHLDPQTLTVSSTDGAEWTLRWPGESGDFVDPTGKLPGVVLSVHHLNAPDVFLAYANNRELAATSPLSLISDWHRKQWWRFSHFPCSYRPFEHETNSQATGKGAITHGGLVCLGAMRDTEWTREFSIGANGRKYRQWFTLGGLTARRDTAGAVARTRSWMQGASVRGLKSTTFRSYDPRTLEIGLTAEGRDIAFELVPESSAIINPLIRVDGWNGGEAAVDVASHTLLPGEYRVHLANGTLWLWICRTFTAPQTIRIYGTGARTASRITAAAEAEPNS